MLFWGIKLGQFDMYFGQKIPNLWAIGIGLCIHPVFVCSTVPPTVDFRHIPQQFAVPTSLVPRLPTFLLPVRIYR
jgi:hypothetical protein